MRAKRSMVPPNLIPKDLDLPKKRKRARKIDSKNLCIFCYKSVIGETTRMSTRTVTPPQRRELNSRYFKMVSRYLGLDVNLGKPRQKSKCNDGSMNGPSGNLDVTTCDDCFSLTMNFCQVYAEMEQLRLKLGLNLVTMRRIMRCADKVPSRYISFTKLFEGNGARKLEEKRDLDEFRRQFIQKSLKPLAAPKVTVSRLDGDKKIKVDHEGFGNQVPFSQTGQSKVGVEGIKTKQDTDLKLGGEIPFSLSTSKEGKENLKSTVQIESLAEESKANSLTKDTIQPEPAVEDMPVDSEVETTGTVKNATGVVVTEADSSNEDNAVSSSTTEGVNINKESELRRNSITITDSGKTILLPKVFKTEQVFVDESEPLMDYEDNCDTINPSDDIFFGSINSANASTDNPDVSNDLEPMDESQHSERNSSSSSTIQLNDKTCRECRIELSCRAELEKHRVIIHKLQSYVECPACKEMLPCYYALKRHREQSESCAIDKTTEYLEFETIAKPIFPYSSTIRGNKFCPLEGCFEVFLKSENLELHLKAHGSFQCKFCRDKFEKGHDLAMHEAQVHSQDDGFKCMRCNFHVGSQNNYVVHFLSAHLQISPYVEHCEVCQRGFVKSVRLKDEKELHFKTHHDVKGISPEAIFKCDKCNAPFLKKLQLKKHLINVHDVQQDTRVRCSICFKAFLNAALLLQHKLKVHENLEDHVVKAQVEQQRLNRLNTTKRKYKCAYCNLTFTTKFNCDLHQRKHELENQKESEVMDTSISQDSQTLETTTGEDGTSAETT